MAATLAELVHLQAELLDNDPKLAFCFSKELEATAAMGLKEAKRVMLENGFVRGEWGQYELTAKQSPGRYDYTGVHLITQTEARLKYLREVAQTIVEPMADTLTGEVIEPATYSPGPLTIEMRKKK